MPHLSKETTLLSSAFWHVRLRAAQIGRCLGRQSTTSRFHRPHRTIARRSLLRLRLPRTGVWRLPSFCTCPNGTFAVLRFDLCVVGYRCSAPCNTPPHHLMRHGEGPRRISPAPSRLLHCVSVWTVQLYVWRSPRGAHFSATAARRPFTWLIRICMPYSMVYFIGYRSRPSAALRLAAPVAVQALYWWWCYNVSNSVLAVQVYTH